MSPTAVWWCKWGALCFGAGLAFAVVSPLNLGGLVVLAVALVAATEIGRP